MHVEYEFKIVQAIRWSVHQEQIEKSITGYRDIDVVCKRRRNDMSRLVYRDPFARGELHAKRIHHPDKDCYICGDVRRTKAGVPWLYQFWWEWDGISANASREHIDQFLYCSRECRDSTILETG
jgi:hypothetical protein